MPFESKYREPIIHEVKSWTHLFQAAISGRKKHDIRIMDRDYRVGDTLVLQEYDYSEAQYTGRFAKFRITYITSEPYGRPTSVPCVFSPICLNKDYGVLSIELIP